MTTAQESPGLDLDRLTPWLLTSLPVQWILDKAIQVHGAGGLSQDFPLANMYAGIRTLRLADGPDEVHKNARAKAELRRQAAVRGAR